MSDNTSMDIRRYRPDDLEQIARLFYETVHAVNRRDYTARQLDVWATGEINHRAWDASLLDHLTYVATEGRTAICDRLENETSAGRVVVHASITARPFFEKRGYKTIKPQEVERQGIILRNYLMAKDL